MFTQKHVSTKKGFTLIELMVVIVIIGILAAIAIPKLFGMTAKAKASEVGPAAGTWSKMQAAYMMETPSGKPGPTFAAIGYTPPGSPVNNSKEEYSSGTFTYKSDAQEAVPAVPANPEADPPISGSPAEAGKAIWKAISNTKLNDCAEGSTWRATYSEDTDRPVGTISTTESGSNDDAANCKPLTPNFSDLR